MLTLPNLLSIARIPLALIFLKQSIALRLVVVFLAMVSDFLDGFLARRFKCTSQVGAFLDPVMDKFFVFFVLGILLIEQRLTMEEIGAMVCRDFAVIFFGIYLVWKGTWAQYKFRSIWCGKVTTSLQLLVLMGLTLQIQIPGYMFTSFIILGILALLELYLSYPQVHEA